VFIWCYIDVICESYEYNYYFIPSNLYVQTKENSVSIHVWLVLLATINMQSVIRCKHVISSLGPLDLDPTVCVIVVC
jgi:hypothetical protein